MTGKSATERLAADDAGIARAADVLRGGGLVALPTETVYDPQQYDAVTCLWNTVMFRLDYSSMQIAIFKDAIFA